jgi:hypothetical protein
MQMINDVRGKLDEQQWIPLVAWCAACMTARQCLRFELGIYPISGVAVVIGIALIWASGKSNKTNPSKYKIPCPPNPF